MRALKLVRERARAGEPCGICGRPIDLSLPQYELRNGRRIRTPWSLECDEIVPISRGGSPTNPNNLQPTHRVCNQRKGNKTMEELEAASSPKEHQSAVGAAAGRW